MHFFAGILLTMLLIGSTVVGQIVPPPPPPIDSVKVVASAGGPANSAKVKSDATGNTTQNNTNVEHEVFKWSTANNPAGAWKSLKFSIVLYPVPKSFSHTIQALADYPGQLVKSGGQLVLVRNGQTIAGPNYNDIISAS